MPGGKDLKTLIHELKPELNRGEYVFCQLETGEDLAHPDMLGWFREKEGTTAILPREHADALHLSYSLVCRWITLGVISSLEAVGLTSAVSQALTEARISCNVVAAYSHDHLFVPAKDAERALEVLQEMMRRE
jgi:hypothetical protein